MAKDPGGMGTDRQISRVGVLVPFTNTNLEPDLIDALASRVSLHFTRIAGYEADIVPGTDEMAAMAKTPVHAAFDLLLPVRPQLVLYGCSSAMLAVGADAERKAVADMSAQCGVPVVTAAGTIIAGLRDLAISTIAVFSPYEDHLVGATADYFRSADIAVVSTTNPSTALSSLEQGALTPETIFDLAIRADHRDADAIVIPCTDLRAVACIEPLEERLGKPVVTANQALMYAAATRLNLGSDTIPGMLGRHRARYRATNPRSVAVPFENDVGIAHA